MKPAAHMGNFGDYAICYPNAAVLCVIIGIVRNLGMNEYLNVTRMYINNIVAYSQRNHIVDEINRKKMLVVNLWGGPGTGKSTLAAQIFAALKIRGVNAELVTEFAKDLVWTERTKELGDQVYILGKMYHKLWRLKDKVEIAVIDSPLPLCIHYGSNSVPGGFGGFVMSCYNQFKNYNILLERNFPYQQEGRYQGEEDANNVHNDIKKLMKFLRIEYVTKQSPNITSSSLEHDHFVQKLVDEIMVEHFSRVE